MKKKYILPLVGALCFFGGKAIAGEIESFGGFYAPATVGISTSAWTRIPSTSTVTSVGSRRVGLYFNLPATASANMVGLFDSCSTTFSAVATTIRPLEFIRTEGSYFIPMTPSVCLYLLSLHTSAENIHYQEVR